MNTKSKNNKSNKKKGTRIGNFIVDFDKGNFNSVKISAVSGNWNVRYREDNVLYSWIKGEITSEEGRSILHMVFATWYAACNTIPDEISIPEILKAYYDSIERTINNTEPLSDEEHNKILEEEKQNYNNLKNGTGN